MILIEARNTPIKTFSIAFFLSLYYTFITYDGRKSNEQRAKSKKQRAIRDKKRTKINKQRAKNNEYRAKSNG